MTTQTLCYHRAHSRLNGCRHSAAAGKYLCEKVDGMASGKSDSVIPRSLMDRLMMKNSAGFKVERLWYATSSRMQLPMRDRRPVGATGMSELSLTFRNHRDLRPFTQRSGDLMRCVVTASTHRTRCRASPWPCRAPWRWWRRTHQMLLRNLPSEEEKRNFKLFANNVGNHWELRLSLGDKNCQGNFFFFFYPTHLYAKSLLNLIEFKIFIFNLTLTNKHHLFRHVTRNKHKRVPIVMIIIILKMALINDPLKVVIKIIKKHKQIMRRRSHDLPTVFKKE